MIAMKTMFLQEAVKAPVQGSEASGEEEEEDEGQMFDVIKSFHPRFVELQIGFKTLETFSTKLNFDEDIQNLWGKDLQCITII